MSWKMLSSQDYAAIDPALLDVELPSHDGYPEHLAAGDTTEALMQAAGETARSFPEEWWIEPSDWADKARDNDKHKTWARNYTDRFTNQDPTHECTCHSLIKILESALNRHRGIIFPDGPKKNYRYPESAEYSVVWLSPLSVYIEANPQKWGGAGIRQVLEIAARRGVLPDLIQPRDYNFEHALQGTTGRGNSNQSSGDWVRLSQLPPGWEKTSGLFKPKEIIFPESFEQTVCMILNGVMAGVGRKGHAIPWDQLIFEGNNLKAAGYCDSYDIVRYDSVKLMRSAWRGCFGVASMTTPDNWDQPAK